MAIISELHSQNHKLIESSNVLLYLLQERSMCDTETACQLLFEFIDNMNSHFDLVDSLYKVLLSDKSTSTNNSARSFMSGEQELKRIINQYTKQWCRKNSSQIRVGDHDRFKQDTQDLFKIVLSRIQDETEHLYPMAKNSLLTKQVADEYYGANSKLCNEM